MPDAITKEEFAASHKRRDEEMMFLVGRIHALHSLLEEIDGELDRQLHDDEFVRQLRNSDLDIPADCEHHFVIREAMRRKIRDAVTPEPDTETVAFSVGSIVRFGDGPTALMEITSFSGTRAYGDHAVGGSVGAEITDLRLPSDEDMRTWHRECARGRQQ